MWPCTSGPCEGQGVLKERTINAKVLQLSNATIMQVREERWGWVCERGE